MKRIASIVLCLALMMTSLSQTVFIAFAAGIPTITCESKECYPGDSITIDVTVSNNPGITYLGVTPTYSAELGTPTITNGVLFSITKGNNLIFDSDEDVSDNGKLVSFSFNIGESVVPGNYSVGLTFRSAFNYNEESVTFTVIPATICVKAVPIAVTGISLDKESATVKTGNTVTLTPVFTPNTATNKNVTWSTSNDKIATVEDGVVSGVKEGTATITVKTDDGNYTATCAITVECGHNTTHDVSAEASTCQKQGHGAYTVCDECGSVISGSDELLPLGGHNYTENAESKYLVSVATCNKKAVYYKSCSVCGVASTETFEYGNYDANNHVGNTYKKNQKEATCYEEGYTGDVYCSDCDKKTSDGTVIQKNAHNPASTWSTDADYHWHDCQTIGCGNLIDKAAHSGGEATCKHKAVCSVCGVEYGSLNADNHKNTEIRNAKNATCCEDGYTGDTYCTDCGEKIASGSVIQATAKHVDVDGKWETDGTNHWHTCYFGTKFDETSHSGGTATCKDKAKCSICGVEYGELNANNHTGGSEVRNAETASCNTNGYTGDTYCKGCGEKIANGSVIQATGDHVDADGKWECNGTQHYHTCSCGTKFDYTNHSGGTATCKVKAKCSVCGAEYGELNANNHTGGTEVRNAETASCNTNGYTGDTYCKGCGEMIASGSLIQATGDHVDADGEWECNGTQHYHTCSCGTKFDYTNHSGGTATCKDKAKCSICGAEYGELNANNHVGNTYKKNQKEATCYEEGYTGDVYCSGCDKKISDGTAIQKKAHNPASTWSTDEDYHWHDCQTIGCGNLIDKAAHSGGEATCKHKAVCSVCGVEYGSLNADNHKNTEIRNAKNATCCENGYTGDTYCTDCGEKIASGSVIQATGKHVDVDGKWETDGTNHWHTCYFGTKFDETSHSGGTATCKDKAKCSVCGTEYGEKDADSHTGNIEIKNAKEAKCNAEGYTGDTYCKDCGKKLESGHSVEKISHNISGWTVTKEATVSECGEKTGKCTSCGEEFKTETAKLTSKPIEEKNTEYEGMQSAPKLVPSGDTVLPENAVFVAEKKNTENLTTEEKAEVDKAVKELESNIASYVGEGKKAEKVDVLCVFNFDLLLRNTDKQTGDSLGDEEYHFDGSVNVTVEMPEAMKTAKNPCIVHLKDDGTCEAVAFTKNSDGTISFTVTGFSSFVLLDVETSAVTEKDDNPTSPQTGDNSMMTLWIIMFAASSVGLVIISRGRKKKAK